MDEKKFDALCKAVSSIEQVLWTILKVIDSNVSDKDATNNNIALRNYRYFMGIAQGDPVLQAIADKQENEATNE